MWLQARCCCDDFCDCGHDVKVTLFGFEVLKETPKGVWISPFGIGRRWINSTGRKRYAYPTIEEAALSFQHRQSRKIAILQGRIDDARRAIEALPEALAYAKKNPSALLDAEGQLTHEDPGLCNRGESTLDPADRLGQFLSPGAQPDRPRP